MTVFKPGDKVTTSERGWWNGQQVVHKVFKKGLRVEGCKLTIPFYRVRHGHSKTWEDVQAKFGDVWYK